MEYNSYSYLYPPRPDQKVAKGMLGFFAAQGYWAQKKKNGTCTVIFAKGDEVIFKTRHPEDGNGDHKMWKPLDAHREFFAGSDKWNVYVAELLHSKTPTIKNQLFIFDKIVHQGIQLVGTTLAERSKLLLEQWELGADEGDQFRVGEYVSIAHNFTSRFVEKFNELGPEDEGLVLKRPNAKLQPCFTGGANNGWQAKCRIPTKNYAF